MGVRRTTIGDITVLEVSGNLVGGDETDELQRAIGAEEEAGNSRLILDLSRCSTMNSTAAAMMIVAFKAYVARGAMFGVCVPQRKLAFFRSIPGLRSFDSFDEAVASFALGTAAR